MGTLIYCCDEKFGWTFPHAIGGAGRDIPKETVRMYFRHLKSIGLEELMWEKDEDGDISLQSALKTSKCLAEYIKVFFEEFPEHTKKLLCSMNKKEKTALHIAFEEREWEALEVMLELCVKYQLLPHLTGFQCRGAHNTLLHRAFKQGHIEYLEILLKVCCANKLKHNIVLQALLVPNSKNETPWYYLANRSAIDWKKALLLVKNSNLGISVDELYLDDEKSTLLHKSYRRCDQELIDFLRRELDADENRVNERRLSPKDRNHRLDIKSQKTRQTSEEHSKVKSHTQVSAQIAERLPEGTWNPPQISKGHLEGTQDPSQITKGPPKGAQNPLQIAKGPPEGTQNLSQIAEGHSENAQGPPQIAEGCSKGENARDLPQTVEEHFENTQGSPQIAKGRPENARDLPQIAKGRPENAQDLPQIAKGHSEKAQGSPQIAEGCSKGENARDLPQTVEGHSENTQGPPQTAEGCLDGARDPPQIIKGHSKSAQGPPQIAEGCLEGTQNLDPHSYCSMVELSKAYDPYQICGEHSKVSN